MPGLAGLAAACTRASSSVRSSSPVGASVAPSRSLTPATSSIAGRGWHTLAASLDGRLIRPGEPGYPTARLVYDPLYDDVRPRAVVQAASAKDVATTIRFVRDHGMPFAARSGGHSYGGYSVSNGIVIDVTAMSSVHADPSARQATIGSGATLMQVADGLAPDGLVVPGGTCATVGIAGLALGGGQGVTGRRFGLTCDSMLGATVVLADGSVVRLRREPASRSVLGPAWRRWRQPRRGHVLHVHGAPAHAAHHLLALVAMVEGRQGGRRLVVVGAVGATRPLVEPPAPVHPRLRPAGVDHRHVVGRARRPRVRAVAHRTDSVPPATSSSSTMPYLDVAKLYAGCSGQSADACTLQIHGGVLPRQASLAKSDFFDVPDRRGAARRRAGADRVSFDGAVARQLGWRGPRRLGR